MDQDDYVTIKTHPCRWCGEAAVVVVLRDHYSRWRAGELVQVAFPEMPADQRELLVSGTHPKCWDEMWEAPDGA